MPNKWTEKMSLTICFILFWYFIFSSYWCCSQLMLEVLRTLCSRKTSFKFINDFSRALPPKSMLISPTHTLPQLSTHLPLSTTTFIKQQHWSDHPIYHSWIPTMMENYWESDVFPLSSLVKWNFGLTSQRTFEFRRITTLVISRSVMLRTRSTLSFPKSPEARAKWSELIILPIKHC